ncbi:hypothetical protein DSO57_1008878 [Entomophthora muscae]|uniref:Uncharacterized protein n=1 Tax=Entomophthora muscae TaxID=34485 RepID=A0ACC2RY61_9FUNG|nr:hypothetical protein DSO57_1008878 [Entomophthora muscae]
MDNSDMEDPNAYGYSVLAIPKTIAVPYKLCSGKTTMTAKPLLEAKENVSCPYLTQAKRSLVVADPEWIRRKVVHLGIKQWNNCVVALLHPGFTSDKDV